MSKFIKETRACIADAYGNRFIKDRVFHCICTFCVSSTNSELTAHLDETTKDDCKARLYTGRAFINFLNNCSYCDDITTCNGLVVALYHLANMVSLGVNLCLSTASYGVDSSGRYSNENRQT